MSATITEQLHGYVREIEAQDKRITELENALNEAADVFENRTNFIERAEKYRVIAQDKCRALANNKDKG